MRGVTRKTSLLVHTVLAAILVGAGFAVIATLPAPVAAAPDPNQVFINSMTYGGTGCPQDNVGKSIALDGLTFTMIFDEFIATTGPTTPVTESSKACQVTIDLHAPAGWTWAIASFQSSGYVSLPNGVTASVSTEFQFADQVASSQESFTGPVAKDYLFSASTPPLNLSSEECGGDGVLTVNAGVDIDSPSSALAQITTDSIDGKFTGDTGIAQGFQIVWSQCTPLCYDQIHGTTVAATKWLASSGTLTGTPSGDVLVGSHGSDTISGLGGNDVICSAPSDGSPGDPDKIDGGGGNDSITGVGQLLGGSGNDYLSASGAGTVADGGSGNDTVEGTNVASLLGDSGSDVVINLEGTPKIDCGAAYDLVEAGDATIVRRCEGVYVPD